jgi:hypothetical protein
MKRELFSQIADLISGLKTELSYTNLGGVKFELKRIKGDSLWICIQSTNQQDSSYTSVKLNLGKNFNFAETEKPVELISQILENYLLFKWVSNKNIENANTIEWLHDVIQEYEYQTTGMDELFYDEGRDLTEEFLCEGLCF